MKSTAGSILLLISGILSFLGAALFLLFGLGSITYSKFIIPSLMFFIMLVLVGLGILKIWASNLMKKPKTTTKGGIIGLITGIVSGIDLLAVIGGIVGIIQGEQ